jgi:hypothetical protein
MPNLLIKKPKRPIDMGIIKTIKLDGIEECIKDIVRFSFQIKLYQEEYGDVMKQKKDDRKRLSSGNIPKDLCKKNEFTLEVERKRLALKINQTVDRIGKINQEMLKLVKKNRI